MRRLQVFGLISLVLSAAGLDLRAQRVAADLAPRFTAVAAGVELAMIEDPALVEGAGPVAVHVLRVDPSLVRVGLALAAGKSPGLEGVLAMATRAGAIAAINAGFFLPGGRPAGLLKIDGQVLGTGTSSRAAFGILDGGGQQRFLFDQVQAVWFSWTPGRAWPLPWLAPMRGLQQDEWHRARVAIGGAGLILRDGRPPDDWDLERLRAGFATERHPRTMIGEDGAGSLWLFAIDGRLPGYSIGMTFTDLIALARRFGLRDAVNLDGGGSTTMVVSGRVVNRPSDVTGPRPVSDAIVVLPR
jgi:hypothetical protein